MEKLLLEFQQALQTGTILSLIGAVILSYIAGILSSFTPCVYPMIPITIGYIGGTSERSVRDGWILSSLYVFGMSLIYTVLGVLASLSGKIFGSFTNSTGWYLSLGIIMVLCSLWMMEVFHFDLNIWLSRFIKRKSQTKSIEESTEKTSRMGALILGASSGFIAAPCTTPVLTTILSFIATQKSIILGGTLMMSFALGLGTILVFVGTFASAIKILPKSGRWLQIIKVGSGLLILALGEYYIFKAGTYHNL